MQNLSDDAQKQTPVTTHGNERVVYAIPAKPKKRPSFLYRNADGLLIIWGCVMLAAYLWFNP